MPFLPVGALERLQLARPLLSQSQVSRLLVKQPPLFPLQETLFLLSLVSEDNRKEIEKCCATFNTLTKQKVAFELSESSTKDRQ